MKVIFPITYSVLITWISLFSLCLLKKSPKNVSETFNPLFFPQTVYLYQQNQISWETDSTFNYIKFSKINISNIFHRRWHLKSTSKPTKSNKATYFISIA
ncbi:hypothetical protein ACB098_09G163700 [Castanea mollissima]